MLFALYGKIASSTIYIHSTLIQIYLYTHMYSYLYWPQIGVPLATVYTLFLWLMLYPLYIIRSCHNLYYWVLYVHFPSSKQSIGFVFFRLPRAHNKSSL